MLRGVFGKFFKWNISTVMIGLENVVLMDIAHSKQSIFENKEKQWKRDILECSSFLVERNRSFQN